MSKAQKYVNAEVLMSSRCDELSKSKDKRKRNLEQHRSTEPKRSKNDSGSVVKSARTPRGRFSQYTSLTTSIDQIFMQIQNDNLLKWLAKLKTPPKKRDKNKYCRFHKDHSHNTKDCMALKDEIQAFIQRDFWKNFIPER